MIRWMGALLLSAGSAALGLGAIAHLDGRVRDLRELAAGLSAMSRALTARLAPLDEMLAAAAESTKGRAQSFFKLCAQTLDGPCPERFDRLWEAALEIAPLRLEEGDMMILRRLGTVLGRYDGDCQTAALEEAAQQMEQLLDEAKEQKGQLGRVYGTMGVSAGLLLAILLF